MTCCLEPPMEVAAVAAVAAGAAGAAGAAAARERERVDAGRRVHLIGLFPQPRRRFPFAARDLSVALLLGKL